MTYVTSGVLSVHLLWVPPVSRWRRDPPSVADVSADQPPGVRYALTAGPADVGARVVLRHHLPDGGLTDVLGHVQRWSEGTVEVRTRTGTVLVAEADLVAAKRGPEPPARR